MAFQIGSAFTAPCHEEMTLKAFFANDNLQGENTIIPPNAFGTFEAPSEVMWLQVAEYLETQLDYTFKSDFERFLAITLFIGVRYPDLAHFSITDINNMRDLHMAEKGQEEHSLRSADQDHTEGDAEAILATKNYIMELVDEAYQASVNSRSGEQSKFNPSNIKAQSERVEFYLEYYGAIKVEVWKPLFLLGKAAHALQDSFAHSYRSEDTLKIYAVANYLEALSSDFSEGRDGPRHSAHQDDCTIIEVSPLVDSSIQATRDLFLAAKSYFQVAPKNSGEIELARASVQEVLERWMDYQDGCGLDSNYCGTPWAPLAKLSETFPMLGCHSFAGAGVSLAFLWLFLLLPRLNAILRSRCGKSRP